MPDRLFTHKKGIKYTERRGVLWVERRDVGVLPQQVCNKLGIEEVDELKFDAGGPRGEVVALEHLEKGRGAAFLPNRVAQDLAGLREFLFEVKDFVVVGLFPIGRHLEPRDAVRVRTMHSPHVSDECLRVEGRARCEGDIPDLHPVELMNPFEESEEGDAGVGGLQEAIEEAIYVALYFEHIYIISD